MSRAAKHGARVAVVSIAAAIVLLSGVTVVLVVDLQCAGLREAARLPERELTRAAGESVRATPRPLPPTVPSTMPGVVADLTVDANAKARANAAKPNVPDRPPAPSSASVRGVVRFAGAPPKRERLHMSVDPFCAKHPIDDESVLVGANGGLANVVVRVLDAPPSPPPPANARIAQDACQYRPRVQAVVAGQRVEIVNGDPVLHNAHIYKNAATISNRAQVPGAPPIEQVAPRGVMKLKCDVHQWMSAYVVGHDNALFAVTGDDGAFSIAGLPPGRWTLEAWHERFGTKSVEVVVTFGAPASAAFEFTAADH